MEVVKEKPEINGDGGMEEAVSALIEYGVIEERVDDVDAVITTENLWLLFKKVEEELQDKSRSQREEMVQVEKYVKDVKRLNEERDQLTSEFELENDKLKAELMKLHRKIEVDEQEIQEMCHQEGLDELIGRPLSEQMAYLLVVRATLLDKLEATEEKLQATAKNHAQLENHVKELMSEDSELQKRMNSAMCEMGGMASKLTDALKERDDLRDKVETLSATLKRIGELPNVGRPMVGEVVGVARVERECELLRAELVTKTRELDEARRLHRDTERALLLQIRDLKRPKGESSVVKEETSVEDQGQVLSSAPNEPHKIIEDLQDLLKTGEEQQEKEKCRLEKEIVALKAKIKQLEQERERVEEQSAAQVEEARALCDARQRVVERVEQELGIARSRLADVESGKMVAEQQLAREKILTGDLQERNRTLEDETGTILNQLKEAHAKFNESEREKTRLLLRNQDQEDQEDPVIGAEDRINGLAQFKHEEGKELVNLMRTERARYEEIARKLDETLVLLEAEKAKRLRAEEESDSLRLTSSQRHPARHKEKTDQEKSDCESSEHDVIQKMTSELNREELEEAFRVVHGRMEQHFQQLHDFIRKYRDLKCNHRSKIRRIRELFQMERRATTDEIERLERKLELTGGALQCELSWKQEAAAGVNQAERERRNAIGRCKEAHQKIDESSRRIDNLERSNSDLRSKNGILQSELQSAERRREELEQFVERIRIKQQRQELNTLLTSMTSTASEPIGTLRTAHVTPIDDDDDGEERRAKMAASKDFSSYLRLTQVPVSPRGNPLNSPRGNSVLATGSSSSRTNHRLAT